MRNDIFSFLILRVSPIIPVTKILKFYEIFPVTPEIKTYIEMKYLRKLRKLPIPQ